MKNIEEKKFYSSLFFRKKILECLENQLKYNKENYKNIFSNVKEKKETYVQEMFNDLDYFHWRFKILLKVFSEKKIEEFKNIKNWVISDLWVNFESIRSEEIFLNLCFQNIYNSKSGKEIKKEIETYFISRYYFYFVSSWEFSTLEESGDVLETVFKGIRSWLGNYDFKKWKSVISYLKQTILFTLKRKIQRGLFFKKSDILSLNEIEGFLEIKGSSFSFYTWNDENYKKIKRFRDKFLEVQCSRRGNIWFRNSFLSEKSPSLGLTSVKVMIEKEKLKRIIRKEIMKNIKKNIKKSIN